jgi:HPt (histidine-containing phosphotransfer) domain-containing protein
VNEATAPVLNERILDELRASVEGDRAFVIDLVETYLSDAETQVADVEAAMDASDAEALVRPAHTLKSSSATVGAERMAALARGLEMAGRSGTLDPAAGEVLANLRIAWRETAETIRAWIRTERDR